MIAWIHGSADRLRSLHPSINPFLLSFLTAYRVDCQPVSLASSNPWTWVTGRWRLCNRDRGSQSESWIPALQDVTLKAQHAMLRHGDACMHIDKWWLRVEMNGFPMISQQYCSCRLDSSLINMQSWKRWLNKPRTHHFFCKFVAFSKSTVVSELSWQLGSNWGTPDIQQGCSMLQSRLWINASTWLLWRVLSSLVSSLETKYQIIASHSHD